MVRPEARARAYGFHRSMDHAGAVIGPLLASTLLFFLPGNLRFVFMLSIVPGLAATACVFAARRSQRNISSSDAPVPRSEANNASLPPLPPALRSYLGILFIFTLAGSSDAFLLLKLSRSGVDQRVIPLLWAALHVVKSLGSLAGGRIADRIGRRPSIALGWLWYAAVYATLGLSDNTAVAITIFLAYGLYYGLTESAERAFVAGVAEEGARGRAFGLQNLIEGLGAFPASLLFGFLWKAFGPVAAFFTAAGLAAIASALMIAWSFRGTGSNSNLRPE
jgi:MFS family permease